MFHANFEPLFIYKRILCRQHIFPSHIIDRTINNSELMHVPPLARASSGQPVGYLWARDVTWSIYGTTCSAPDTVVYYWSSSSILDLFASLRANRYFSHPKMSFVLVPE